MSKQRNAATKTPSAGPVYDTPMATVGPEVKVKVDPPETNKPLTGFEVAQPNPYKYDPPEPVPDLRGSVTASRDELGLDPLPPEATAEVPEFAAKLQMIPGSFSEALGLICQFPRAIVTRAGWNEPNKFLTFKNGVIYCTRDGSKCVWSANQADIVAQDWKLA